jgi:hypothetical protein
VTAVLNLVFRPSTKAGTVENPSLSREIDLVIEAALKGEAPAPPDAAAP